MVSIVLTGIKAKTGSSVLITFKTLPNFLISASNLHKFSAGLYIQRIKYSLINDLSREDIAPEVICVAPKAYLHPNFRGLET